MNLLQVRFDVKKNYNNNNTESFISLVPPNDVVGRVDRMMMMTRFDSVDTHNMIEAAAPRFITTWISCLHRVEVTQRMGGTMTYPGIADIHQGINNSPGHMQPHTQQSRFPIVSVRAERLD